MCVLAKKENATFKMTSRMAKNFVGAPRVETPTLAAPAGLPSATVKALRLPLDLLPQKRLMSSIKNHKQLLLPQRPVAASAPLAAATKPASLSLGIARLMHGTFNTPAHSRCLTHTDSEIPTLLLVLEDHRTHSFVDYRVNGKSLSLSRAHGFRSSRIFARDVVCQSGTGSPLM